MCGRARSSMTWRTPVGLMSFQGGPSGAGGRTRSRATGGALGIGGMTGRSPHSTRMRKGEARRRPPSARPCAPSRGFDTAPAATPAPETASTRPPRKKRGRNGFYNLPPLRSLDPRIWKGRALPYLQDVIRALRATGARSERLAMILLILLALYQKPPLSLAWTGSPNLRVLKGLLRSE